MARKSPVKQRKSKAETRRNQDWVGDVTFYEERRSGKWNYWRVDCRSKYIPKRDQRVTYATRKEAETAAIGLNERLQLYKRGRKHPADALGDELPNHAVAQAKLNDLNAKLNPDFTPSDIGEVNIVKAVEIAVSVIEAATTVNRLRLKNGKSIYNTAYHIDSWLKYETNLARRADVLYVQRINEFLKFKESKHGSKRGRKELSKKSKAEWRGRLTLLKDWVGNRKIRDRKDSKDTVEFLLKRIDNGKDPLTAKPWSQRTKFKTASKFKEFGAWLESKDYVKTNPLERLPEQYTPDTSKAVVTYQNEQVEQILAKAITGNDVHQIIPYMVMTLFSTCRPSDIWYDDSKRVMQWSQIKFKEPWPQIKGSAQIELAQFDGAKRTSKTKDRIGLLYPNGIEWLNWYYETFEGGKFPAEFFNSRRKFKRLRKSCDFEWTSDAPRHTSTSCALEAYAHDGVQDFMARRYGNSVAVIRSYYEKPTPPKIAKAYFRITPKSVMRKHGITAKMLKEIVAGK
tara:strand:+ start:938 stop:2473 length:1536 start_codon:yes stop_codon:yes gene_type:complete